MHLLDKYKQLRQEIKSLQWKTKHKYSRILVMSSLDKVLVPFKSSIRLGTVLFHI